MALVAAAFAGGALAGSPSFATKPEQTPYSAVDQLARTLVLVENQYVEPVARETIVDGAVRGLVAELDPHSAYMTPAEFAAFNEDTGGAFGGIGVEVDFRDDLVVVIAPIADAPAARAGIRPGDKIVAVDGKLVRGMPIDKIVRLMRGAPQSRVTVAVKRDGVSELLRFDLVRESIHVRSVDGKRLTGAVGYVRLKQFQTGTHEELLETVAALHASDEEALAGIVLDMRDDPGGLVDEAEAVADELLSSGVIYSTRHRGEVVDEVRAHAGGALSRLPVVVLVNEYSASAAELVAGALHDNGRALLVGARTFGKGSVQTIYELPGGAGMRLTTMRYYTPSGRSIQVSGIEPDVAVEPDEGPHDDAFREGSLEGHLPGEPATVSPKGATVMKGGKRPSYASMADVPFEPAMGDDLALSVAHQRLLAAIAAAAN